VSEASISDFMNSVYTGNVVDAEQVFNSIMSHKMNLAIDTLKVDSAETQFGLNNSSVSKKD
jgi:hypothetical protein